MKKISRIAALLAAGALLFGAVGCSSGGGGSGGGDDDVTEDTVKGTYTMSGGDLASGESNTLVVVGGKIYTKVDYSLGEEEEEEGESSGGSSAPGSTTQSDVKYTLTYVNGETAHEPSYTYDKVGEALEAAQGDTFTFYIEVGTYEIANGRVTGRMIDNKGSYPARAETDDAGHLKSFTVYFSGEEPDEGGESGESDTPTVTFLSGIKGGSSTEPAEAGFFSGTSTKTDDLGITVGDIELQLYKKNGTGWTKIDVSASSTKNASGAPDKAGNVEGVTSVQGQFTTKEDAVANPSDAVLGANGYEMGRVKISVTTGANAVTLSKISGYFASGKSFVVGYVKAGDNEYVQITGTTAFSNNKGFKVDGFEVNQTIPANSTKDVYILLGKNATSAPSAGTTIDVAEVVYEFAAAKSDSTNPNPDGDGEGDKSDDNEGEEPGDTPGTVTPGEGENQGGEGGDEEGDGNGGAETPAAGTTYTFSYEELEAAMKVRLGQTFDDKVAITKEDLTGSNAFLALINGGTYLYRTADNGSCIEIKNKALSVTFRGTGTLKFDFSSTGGSNTSSIALLTPDGSYLAASSYGDATEHTAKDAYGNTYTVSGTTAVTVEYAITEPGTYTIHAAITDEDSTNVGRNTRIKNIVMTDTVR